MLGFVNGSRATLSPVEWGATFSRPPGWCSGDMLAAKGIFLREWQNSAAEMEQPPLTHHYLVLHRGGPKRVTRHTAGIPLSTDVEADSLTLATAGTSHRWITQGPIGFAHLYVAPNAIHDIVRQEFDRDPDRLELIDDVGLRFPLLAALISGLERQLKGPDIEPGLLFDTLVHHILVQFVAECSNLSSAGNRARHAISPGRLTRIFEFIEANLEREIGLAELAAIAGSSRYHFSRSFHEATGLPPYRYLIGRRILAAKRLLAEREPGPIDGIAKRCGFRSRRQFEVMFRRFCGTSPARFRRDH